MNSSFLLRHRIIPIAFPVLIILTMIFLAKSSWLQENSNPLSFAITFDLLITSPLIYLLLIRKTDIPKLTVVPFFGIGIVVATLILPASNQHFLDLAKLWLVPVVEVTILSIVIYKVRKAVLFYKKSKSKSLDFFTEFKNACGEILPPKSVVFFVNEIAVFYYGFFSWKNPSLKKNEFTYHKNSGTIALLIAVMMIVGIETTATHFLLRESYHTLAWILTILSIYSAIQVFGILRSMMRRRILIDEGNLYLRYGILSETTIKLSEIQSIELTTKPIEFTNTIRKLSPLGDLESHNVVIKLKNENTLSGFYGKKRTFQSIAFFVDNKNEFITAIESDLNQQGINSSTDDSKV